MTNFQKKFRDFRELRDFRAPTQIGKRGGGKKILLQSKLRFNILSFADVHNRNEIVFRYLDDARDRYGGLDSILLWPTYTQIGVDDRNQYDLWRVMPGDIKKVIEEFHDEGVKVLVP